MTRRVGPRTHEINAAAKDFRLGEALDAKDNPRKRWREDAACRDRDPDLFFSDNDDYAVFVVCSACQVRAHCLTDALETGEVEGVRGATTRSEREAMLVVWRAMFDDTARFGAA